MVVIDDGVSDKASEFFVPYMERSFDKGQILVYAGDDPPGIFYLMSGEVKVYDLTPEGQELILNVYQPPSFFPMSWAITKSPNKYFYQTSSNARLKIAPAEDTVKFVKANPDVLYDLLIRMYRGVDGILERMTHLMGSRAYERTVFEIVIACRRFGKQLEEGAFIINIKEHELAKQSGLTRETFNREMRKLKSAGLVKISSAGIVIMNLPGLERQLGK